METAIFGGGCFWCTEAVFTMLKGVYSVVPGYVKGIEVVKVGFNPKEISYSNLLTVFFATHDPTSFDRQGADVGSQYRSIVFYVSDSQKKEAERYIKELKTEKPIVTVLEPFEKFTEAEEFHKKFYEKDPSQPYCQLVIEPKIQKVKERFASLLASQK
ncbi:MAG: peptide-methionine (S)-S-oxide reductase [Candidatus Wildermuthbacteria bacterium]|nr:peptide-methionine (S)-S-oxide reductase [Candidatus Wildermuthbacteria bacterium]